MRMIVRLDNIGWNTACNETAWLTIEQGITTAVQVALDGPEAPTALQQLKKYPWISVGWQSDFRGRPVRPLENVTTLVDENGFFRPDLTTAPDVSRVEALLELREELFRCASLLGHIPTYRDCSFSTATPFGRAIGEIDQEFGIITRFMQEPGMEDSTDIQLRWEDRKILVAPVPKHDDHPAELFLATAGAMLERYDSVWISRWSPEKADALCDSRIAEWLVENGIELINYHDALFGTREYQNHLRSIGSELSVL